MEIIRAHWLKRVISFDMCLNTLKSHRNYKSSSDPLGRKFKSRSKINFSSNKKIGPIFSICNLNLLQLFGLVFLWFHYII